MQQYLRNDIKDYQQFLKIINDFLKCQKSLKYHRGNRMEKVPYCQKSNREKNQMMSELPTLNTLASNSKIRFTSKKNIFKFSSSKYILCKVFAVNSLLFLK